MDKCIACFKKYFHITRSKTRGFKAAILCLAIAFFWGAGPEAFAQVDTVAPKPGSSIVDSLLRQAGSALRQSRLTSPEYDNAYDRFQSVLMLDPDNSQARSGLQSILITYAQLVRDDIRATRLSSARKRLKLMNDYYPKNALIIDLNARLRSAETEYWAHRVKQDNSAPVRKEEKNYREYSISAKELKNKSADLIDQLSGVAQELVRTDESILIYARSDADGRWVYKQLKKSAGDYRIRGDIRIGKPMLRILPPIK